MKIVIPIYLLMMLLTGCSTSKNQSINEFDLPFLPKPIQEFVKSPHEGEFYIYMNDDSFLRPTSFCKVICKNGNIYISKTVQGCRGSIPFTILYRENLPTREFFNNLNNPITEKKIQSFLGKDTDLSFANDLSLSAETFNRESQMYSFFSINNDSDIVDMRIDVDYVLSEKGEYILDKITWYTFGSRKMKKDAVNNKKSFFEEEKK